MKVLMTAQIGTNSKSVFAHLMPVEILEGQKDVVVTDLRIESANPDNLNELEDGANYIITIEKVVEPEVKPTSTNEKDETPNPETDLDPKE